VADGETLRVGGLAITARLTPGHTPGATTWTWRACDGPRCHDIVYADSLNAVFAPAFRFTTTPSLIETFRESIAKIEALPCDIIISVHPSGTDMDSTVRKRRDTPSPDPSVNPNGCRAYARGAASRLDARIAEEGKSK
jgi:metallo-beta-lactamase class B